MKVTIEGDLDQVSRAMNLPEEPSPRQARLAENKARQDAFLARRGVVVDAFKLARSSDMQQEMAALLEGIRRTGGVTDNDLQLARQVLASVPQS